MRYQKGESYESWADRVHKYEYGQALQRVANGEDPNLVMEELGKRIIEKMMHPIKAALREPKQPFDAEASRKRYEEAYLKKSRSYGNPPNPQPS